MVWERIGASAGILFFAIFSTAFGLELADFPDPGLVEADEIVGFVEANRQRLGGVVLMYAIAGMAFLWFLGSLRSRLVKLEPTPRLSSIGFGAGILIVGLLLTLSGLQLEILFADFTTLNSQAVVGRWVLFDASGGLIGISPFPRAVFLAAMSLVVVRHGGLPRWLGWIGLLGALTNLLSGLDYLAPADVTFTGHPLADLAVFLIWVLLASVLLTWSRLEGPVPMGARLP